ncbi:gamma-tubulin complex component 6 [Genypterus blacodes]|uniref:gamma-tubulin complex component 6 n=1 Tax=Genypterus blacodes TaxID=154954 RepID=UPI003F75B51A
MYPHPNKSIMPSSCDSSSITELLGALCDCNLSGVSWKRRALGGVSRESFRRTLRKRAYGALLSKLFQDGTSKGPTPAPSATANTPPRNKLLMISFDLRVAGCQEEAERLEEHLGSLPEAASSGLKEVDSVLELLVQLAGSAPPPPTSFSRDYMRRERPVLRRPPPWDYQSEELQRLEARAWGLICAEEWGSLGSVCATQQLMDAPPGTGLLALRTKMDAEERFEKETRLSLFGALQHTRTSDIDIRLDLPPVPSNVDVTGLAIRVPPCLDQSEDEGFQSSSNLTPDSQSETSPSPEPDLWEALRTFEPGKRRCWESVGCPPGKRESLYLTERGREAFDQLYRLWEGEMRVVSTSTPSPLLPLPLDSQTQLVTDLLNILIGVASTTFPLNQCVQFDVRPGVCVSGASPESVARLLGELAQYGTYYLRLSRFSQQSADKRGLVFQAFTGGLRKYLHYYRACVLSTPPNLSLLTAGFLFRKVGRQLRYLSELCCVDGPLGAGQATFPVGVKLLSYLYNEAQNNCSNENYPVLLSLLKCSCEPYTRFVSDWVYSGVFRDVYGEFMIQVNEEYLGFRDKHFWIQGYTLISKDVEDCVPIFLKHIANDVYVCGKTINLLKICCPQHYICWSELPVPRISVTFSLQEVEEIERHCAIYRGRMERIAKHSAISREEKTQRTEQARQELINQVRESAAKTLESIRGRQVSQRLAVEAKKRERFEELKQQLEQEHERRSAAKKREEEGDFGFARELRDREKRLQALEEQLEQRARKELIAQYSRLSEEAARREIRAMWRVQRLRLHEARVDFFIEDEQKTQDILEQYPLGQQRPPSQVLQLFSTATQPTQESPTVEPSEQQSKETGGSEASPPCDVPSSPTLPPLTVNPDLISDDIDVNDFLPASLKPDSQQVDKALQEIGSNIAEPCPKPQLVEYDFSAPFSPLEGMAGPSSVQPRPHWGPAVLPDVPQNHPSYSHFPFGENMTDVQERRPKANPFGQASKSSFLPGHYTPEGPVDTFRSSSYGHPSQSSLQMGDGSDATAESKQETITPQPEPERPVSTTEGSESTVAATQGDSTKADITEVSIDKPQANQSTDAASSSTPDQSLVDHKAPTDLSDCGGIDPPVTNTQLAQPLTNIHDDVSPPHTQIGEQVSDVVPPRPSQNIHGHSSDAHIKVGEYVSDVTAPLPSPNVHGHSSDAHIKIGEYVSDVTAPLPSPNVHGHSSDAHIKIGEYVSDVTAPLPSPNVHGHSSDAHIKIGENVSEVDSVRPSAAHVYGHSSDSHIIVGENVSDFVASFPIRNIHGHASDAHINIGEHVSDVVALLPTPSVHGHVSDSHIQVGQYVSEVPSSLPTPGIHGHSSDANIKIGEFVSNVAEARPRSSKHGHSEDSALQPGCIVSGIEPASSPLPGSAYGHSSDSTLGFGCVVSGAEPKHAPLPGSAYGHSSDSALGVGCVVLGAAPLPSAVPGSAYGHSLDSSLGSGCVVKVKGSGDQQTPDDKENNGSKSESLSEQLAEGMGSWAAILGLSPGERSEREYLTALAAQYQVEHYEDCYNLMGAALECQLLKQVTWGLSVDPTFRKATDITGLLLSEMVSLPVLIKHSVTTPLITHVSLVNKAIVDYFFAEMGVERHFEALRHFLLMEDGEFAQSLSDLLFEKLGSGQTPGELLTPLVLNSILSKSLQYSLHGDCTLAGNFTFALRFLPETFHPHAPDSLNCLELRYKVDWPLNIIITDSCLNKYNRLFSFLLQLKHMVWSLRDVWFHLKRTALVKGAGRSVQFRQLQLYRHEMQHFVKVIQGYIANQILQVSWSEFTAKLATANDLDAIHRTHADYLNRAIFRGLLTEKAAPVMNIIHSIFSLILKFRAQLIAQPWDSQQGEAVHPSFIAMQQSYNTFKYYSHFLFKVVTKLVNRGYQPHLEDFLLRINFNNYYRDS